MGKGPGGKMALTMSALPMSPEPPPESRMPRADPADSLFKDLVVSDPDRIKKTGTSWWASVIGHTVGILLVVLVRRSWSTALAA